MEGLRIAPVIALTVMRQVRHEHGHLLPGQPISSTVAKLSSLEKKRGGPSSVATAFSWSTCCGVVNGPYTSTLTVRVTAGYSQFTRRHSFLVR